MNAPLSQDRGYVGGVRRRGPNRKGVLTLQAVTALYDAGHTQDEIAQQLDVSQYKVWYFMREQGIATRPQIKRDQKGTKNHGWKGEQIRYLGSHKRVYRARGKAFGCEHCGTKEQRMYHWANVSGNYLDVNDFVSLCVPCHSAFDRKKRNAR